MKWVKLILLILCLSTYQSNFSQAIGIRALTPIKKDVERPKYDTTFIYFDLSKLEDNPHYYDNQEILFSPCIDTIRYYNYFGGFSTKDSIEMKNCPDTIWIKKKPKKVKEGDFYVKYPKTNVYMPTFVENDYVYDLSSYTKLKREQGFYTSFEHIEGHIFTIIEAKKTSADNYTLYLSDDKGIMVDFNLYISSNNYPCILMMSYISKHRNIYFNNKFHVKEDSNIYLSKAISTETYYPIKGELVCHDISLIKGNFETIERFGEGYVNLYRTDLGIFFRDDNEREFCISPTDNSLGYFRMQPHEELCESFKLEIGKSHYLLQLKDLITSEEYYAIKEKERIKEEQRIAKDNAQKAARKAHLIDKYGKTNAELILRGHVKIGMTSEMCREAWGAPYKINRSTGIWGVHEQWCYKWGGYLYMENDILTSIQD